MALIGTPNFRGTTMQVVGIAGVNDNDIVIELDDVQRFNSFTFQSDAGAMSLDVSVDGSNFNLDLAFTDLHSLTPATKVIATVADLLYRFEADIKAIRIRQEGATDATGAILICGQAGRTH